MTPKDQTLIILESICRRLANSARLEPSLREEAIGLCLEWTNLNNRYGTSTSAVDKELEAESGDLATSMATLIDKCIRLGD
jgi:hypothetical protein